MSEPAVTDSPLPEEPALPVLWRGLTLLLMGLAVLAALAGGDEPASSSRELTALACALLTLVSLLAVWRRRSAASEPVILDGLILLALPLAVFAQARSPLPSHAWSSALWLISLAGVYLAARLIGPHVFRPALALWAVLTAGLSAVRTLWPETFAIDRVVLLEWALAFALFLACWGRQTWARRIQTTGLFWLRRTLLSLLILAAAGVQLLHNSGGDLLTHAHRRALGLRTGADLFWQQPLWGWGGGSWQWAVASLPEPPGVGEAIAAGAPGWVAVAGGFAGVVAFLTVGFGLLVTLAFARRPDKPARMGTPLMAAASIAIAWGLMGLWSPGPLRPANLILFTLFFGTALSLDLGDIPWRSPLEPPSRPWRRLLLGAAVAVALLLTAALVATPLTARWIRRAPTALDAADRAARAAAAMPWRIEWPLLEAQFAGAAALGASGDAVARLLERRMEAFARARALNPYDATLTLTPAQELAGRGFTEQAETLLREGLSRTPLSSDLAVILATLLEQRGEVGEAFNVLRPIDRLRPEASTKLTLARLSWHLGARDQAERYALEALQLGNRSGALTALLREMDSPLLEHIAP